MKYHNESRVECVIPFGCHELMVELSVTVPYFTPTMYFIMFPFKYMGEIIVTGLEINRSGIKIHYINK